MAVVNQVSSAVKDLAPELESAWNEGELVETDRLRHTILCLGGFPNLLLPDLRY